MRLDGETRSLNGDESQSQKSLTESHGGGSVSVGRGGDAAIGLQGCSAGAGPYVGDGGRGWGSTVTGPSWASVSVDAAPRLRLILSAHKQSLSLFQKPLVSGTG